MAIIINNISFEPDPALNITGTLDTREGANIDSGKKISQIVGIMVNWLQRACK